MTGILKIKGERSVKTSPWRFLMSALQKASSGRIPTDSATRRDLRHIGGSARVGCNEG